jgi:uncharacterized membrane protein YhaH (DUF805 family)
MSTFDQATTKTVATNAEQAYQPMRRVPVIRDRLTIFRILVIVTALAIGIALYLPNTIELAEVDSWRWLATTFMIGLSLAGPVFAFSRRRSHRLGASGLLALTLGLGVLVMMPPAIMIRCYKGEGHIEQSAVAVCLFYSMPMMSLWYLLAMTAGGRLTRRSFSRATPWSERYGLFLALLWSPLGMWVLWDCYSEAFF